MTVDVDTSPSKRLDSLPFTRRHGRLLFGSGIGWALDAMDVGLISFIVVALTAQWKLQPEQVGLISSVGFAGMAIGASVGGLLADKFGRRQVFAVTLLIYGIATGASALVGGIAMLLVLRFIVGLGLGSELPVASTYVSEFAPARMRGRLIVILEAFWAIGWTASALIGFLVVPTSPDGWRWAFAIGAIPALYALFIRWRMPESPRWLESKGRVAEAQQIVDRFAEGTTPVGQPAEDQPVDAVTAAPQTFLQRLRSLWAPGIRRSTASLWLVWFCVNFSYYGAFIWIPTLLFNQGYPLTKSFGFTLLITLAQLPGYAVSAWLIEVIGRRYTLSIFLVGSAVAALWFGNAASAGEMAIILSGMLLSFFNLGAWGALYAVSPEVYPTALRATGAGWAAGVGRIASIVAPLSVPFFMRNGGTVTLFIVFSIFFVIAAIAIWGVRELRGKTLTN